MAHEIITLCGSVRFARAHLAEHRRLSLQGQLVLMPALPGCDASPSVSPSPEVLGDLHRRKIDLSARVHVVDVDGYIGASTRAEIAYAENQGKRITYMSNR